MSNSDSRTASRVGSIGCLLFSLAFAGAAVFLLGMLVWDEGPPGPDPSPISYEGALSCAVVLPVLFFGLVGVVFSMKALLTRRQAAAPQTHPPKVTPFLIIILGLIGLAGLYVASMCLWGAATEARRFESDDLKMTEGTIVRLEPFTTRSNREGVWPVVRFEADDGPYEFRGQPETWGPPATRGSYAIGQKVKVLYPPENPRLGRMEHQSPRYSPQVFSVVGAASGGVFVAALLVIVWLLRRQRRLATPNG